MRNAAGAMSLRRRLGLWLGPLLALAVLASPLPSLSPPAHRLASIMTLVVVLWISEPLPVYLTGVLGALAAVLVRAAGPQMLLSSFLDPIIFLFIGSFMLAKAMQIHGVDRRIAYAILVHPWVEGSTYRVLAAFGLTAWLLAMWTGITACAAMLLPVALAIAAAAGTLPGSRYSTSLLLMLTYAASAGAMATPVGTPPNLIGIGLIHQETGVRIGFLQWMSFGLPVAAALLAARYALLVWLFPPDIPQVPGQLGRLRRLIQEMGPWTRGQRNTLIAFGTAITLWVLPGVAGTLSPGVAALLAAGLLFFLPMGEKRRRFTLHWKEAVSIDWGTVLLFGSGIALGRMMFETGLAGAVGSALLSSVGDQPGLLLGAAVLIAALLSELASNTAAASMIIPVMLGFYPGNPAAGTGLALAATLGASLGFMFPVSTPANAMIHGSGAVRMKDLVKGGFWVDITGVGVIWAAARWLIPLTTG